MAYDAGTGQMVLFGGGLSCDGNTPAASDDNQPNTVNGGGSGECAGTF